MVVSHSRETDGGESFSRETVVVVRLVVFIYTLTRQMV